MKEEPTFLELCDDTSAYVNSFVSDIVGREDEERIRGLVMERKEKNFACSDLSDLVYFLIISDVWFLMLTKILLMSFHVIFRDVLVQRRITFSPSLNLSLFPTTFEECCSKVRIDMYHV